MNQNTLNALLQAAAAEYNENKTIITNYLKQLNALVNPNVDIEVKFDVVANTDKSVCILFLNSKGLKDFGNRIEFKVSQPYSPETNEYGEPEFRMTCAPWMGSAPMYHVTKSEEPYRVCCCYLMAELWKHEQQILELFNSLKFDADKAALEAQREYDVEQGEIKKQEDQKLKDEINSKLVVGYTFIDHGKRKGENIGYSYTIEKITPKRYYLRYVENKADTRSIYDPESGKLIQIDHGTSYVTQTGYINRDLLSRALFRQVRYDQWGCIYIGIEGIEYVKTDFKVQSSEIIFKERA